MVRGKSLAFAALILTAIIGASVGPAAHAATLSVPDQYETIARALEAAVAGDRVVVQPGIYSESNLNLPADVILTGAVEDSTQTVIDAGGRGRILQVITPGDRPAVVRYLTLRNGWARGTTAYEKSGGAIYVNGAALEIQSCVFRTNRADAHGGAIRALRTSPHILDSVFTSNTALFGGGGALDCSYEASPLVENCRFIENFAAWGGAVACRGASNPELLLCKFGGNRSDGSLSYGGGAVSFFESEPEYRYCTFYENESEHGGAVAALVDAPARLEHCTVTENSAASGAGLFSREAASSVEASLIVFQDGTGVTAEGDLAVQISHTNVHGNSSGDLDGLPEGTSTANGNISADPLFCESQDLERSFSLDVESPCVTEGPGGTMGAWEAGCAGDRGEQQPTPDPPRVLTIQGVQAAPNPFNPSTRIRFELESSQRIVAEIFSIDGRRVRRLVDQIYTPGWNTLHWNGLDDSGRSVGSGTYVTRLQGEEITRTIKVTLLK